MPTPVRRHLRHARRGLGYTIAIALVLVALVLGVASQVLPLAERNPEAVATWLSQRAGRTIAFDGVETEWTRRGPLLQLDNLRIGKGDQAFTIGDTEMLVSIYAGLLPNTPFSELRLRGLDLTLERVADGRWQVRGLPGQQQAGVDPFEALEDLGELQVIDGKLAVIAPKLGIDARIPKIDMRVQVSGDRVRAGVRAWPGVAAGVDARPVDAVLDLDRDSGDGQVYAGTHAADLAQWSSLLRLMGVALEGGSGRAEAWATLEGRRISGITVDAALDQVVLRGTPVNSSIDSTGQTQAPRTRFDRVEARARWRLVDGGWRFDAPALAITSDGTRQRLDGLLLAGGERYAAVAEQIDIGPLVAIAALSDRLPPQLRRWLQQARPRASLRDIEIVGRRGGPMHASARIDELGFDPVGDAPGMRGLAGVLEGDAEGFQVRFDAARPVAFDWPSGFGVTHVVTLDGTVNGWREGEGWRIGTAALAIDGDGFGANARGGLWWQGDGSRPWIDVAATLDDVSLPVAKGFWIHHKMPAKVIEWLDTALVAGTVQDGRALIAGDLDDWPFEHHDGRFEATGHIADATIRFQPDWPAAEDIELDASFIGNGFTVTGSGALGDIAIRELNGAIDHYGDGALTVQAQADGDIAALFGVLRQSPLRGLNPETFDSVRASGAAELDFSLRLPLQPDSKLAINGDVELDNARLADPRWDIAFDRVSGRATYTHTGFHANALRVHHDGHPGVLSLRAGTGHVRDRGNAFEAGLGASFDADALIARAPDLAWLKPHLQGRSRWNVGVAVPKSGNRSSPARLQLNSDLVGTALELPAPLRKPAATALMATVDTPLPMGSGDIHVGLGDVLSLRARSSNGRTGVRIALGSSRVEQAPPASGLVASGRTDRLDAIAWIGLMHGGQGGNSLPLQRIDVTAQRLQLFGGEFPGTRLLVVPAPEGATAVRAEGDALRGALLVPAAKGATIAGRFERVHWRSADPVNAAVPAAAATDAPVASASATPPVSGKIVGAGVDASINPSAIPPLSFGVDDLQINDARLGSATLRTRPTATGLQLEQLQTRAPQQSIDASGSWTGRGDAARTQLSARLDSNNLGALLAGLGFGGRLAGGEGQAGLDVGWPSTPADFSLTALDGRLTLDARDGRLLELEPGAGRVFGLLSIAELPRRLSLDFRDFFSKGFAFNELDGEIRFTDGIARSDDLQIDGPAAEINIRGAANLRSETFNQTVEVLPKAGNLLTAVGAIAGGPVGAAIGAAANAVLQKPLGMLAAKTYKVTGPWADPEVEVITREQGRLSAAEAAPAG